MNTEEKKEIIKKAIKLKDVFKSPIVAKNGYTYRTSENISIYHLYDNLVTVEEPELLSSNGSFLNSLMADIRKSDEQTSLDLKDINPVKRMMSDMAKKAIRGANRKFLIKTGFQEEDEEFNHTFNAFGSAIYKIYNDNGEPIIKNVDVTRIIFNPHNFRGGYKMETYTKTPSQIINDKRYDAEAREELKRKIDKEDLNKMQSYYIFFGKLDSKYVGNKGKKETYQVHFLDLKNKIVLLSSEREEEMYYKLDRRKRLGFADAWGIGMYEENLNSLFQEKTARESLLKVIDKMSMTVMTKQSSDENKDKELVADIEENGLEDESLLLHTEGDIRIMQTVNPNSEVSIYNHLGSIRNFIQKNTGITDTLRGDSNPSDSGIKVSTDIESASSIFKRLQIKRGEFISKLYSKVLLKYVINGLDKKEDISKFMNSSDLRGMEDDIVNDTLARMQKDLILYGTEEERASFDIDSAKKTILEELGNSNLISGELLEDVKKEIKDIEIKVTNNRSSKAQEQQVYFDTIQRIDADPNYFENKSKLGIMEKIWELNPSVDAQEIKKIVKNK